MKHLFLCLLLCVTPVITFGAESDFARTLSVGMRGEDVRSLQRLLNADIETRVAELGAGSLGEETDYFGMATKRALIKFQEKYRAEILNPVGLTAGTGFFGSKTREKLNSIILGGQKTLATALKNSPSLPVSSGSVYVMFPSQYSGKPGILVTITGAGFTSSDNTIYFGPNHAVVKARAQGEKTITFKVPNIPKGLYRLYVKNARGESNKEQWFIVTDGVSPEPKIEKIQPANPSRGDTVTIYGSGFVAEKNTIMVSGVGLFEKVASPDGSSASFVLPKNAFPVKFSPSVTKPSLPISVRVVNENGISNMGKMILAI